MYIEKLWVGMKSGFGGTFVETKTVYTKQCIMFMRLLSSCRIHEEDISRSMWMQFDALDSTGKTVFIASGMNRIGMKWCYYLHKYLSQICISNKQLCIFYVNKGLL